MGRNKSYDRDVLIGRAMEMFRDHGHAATSTPMSGAFRTALTHAHESGQLRPEVDPRAEASFLTSAVLGLFVMRRAKALAEVVSRAACVAIEHLEGLRSPS